MMLKTACDRLLSSFMLVAATVLDLFPSDIRDSMSCQDSKHQRTDQFECPTKKKTYNKENILDSLHVYVSSDSFTQLVSTGKD